MARLSPFALRACFVAILCAPPKLMFHSLSLSFSLQSLIKVMMMMMQSLSQNVCGRAKYATSSEIKYPLSHAHTFSFCERQKQLHNNNSQQTRTKEKKEEEKQHHFFGEAQKKTKATTTRRKKQQFPSTKTNRHNNKNNNIQIHTHIHTYIHYSSVTTHG